MLTIAMVLLIVECLMKSSPVSRCQNTYHSDNDPLFLFHRWIANLSILEIEEVKSVPRVPTSHPFVERVIGSTRRECLDHTLFFNNTLMRLVVIRPWVEIRQ
jgi:hypothetical protein